MNLAETSYPTSKAAARLVRETLEPEQLATVKISRRYGRRTLSRGTTILIWSLRIYVILMVLLVGDQVWQALHL
jgi:hypothetical protein